MAVTIEKYSTEVLNAGGKIYLPLFLTEYGDVDSFLSAFFCDIALILKDKEGKQCILGAIREEGNKGQLRASTRLSHVIVARNESGTVTKYRILNDGGLNTKGYSVVLCDYFFRNYNNFKYYAKASYYDDCTLAVKYKTANMSSYTTIATKSITKKDEVIGTTNVILAIGATSPITLAATMTNTEGDYTASKEMVIKPYVTKVYVYKLDSMADYWDDGEVSLAFIYSTEYTALTGATYPSTEETEVAYSDTARFSTGLISMYNDIFNLADGYYAINSNNGFKVEDGSVTALFNPVSKPVVYPYIEFLVSMQYPYTEGTNTCRVNVSAKYVIPTGATNPSVTTTLSGVLGFCNKNGVGIVGGEWTDGSDFSLVVPVSGSTVSQQLYGTIEEDSDVVGAKPTTFTQNPTTYSCRKEYLDNSGNNIP